MYPQLLEIPIFGFTIPVYSYGLMVAIAYLTANYFLTKELQRRKIEQADALGSNITIFALAGGLGGAKLFHLLENPSEFFANPINAVFNGAGLTYLGGFIVAVLLILWYLRRKKFPFLLMADAASPSMAIGYGIGRIGCQLAGDGDYGIPTDLPWGMAYPNGVVPTLEIVHPAPVYETIVATIIFGVLWKLSRTINKPVGWIFALYLILTGTARLLVEFIRLNDIYWGLSQAQWISAGMIIVGSFMLTMLNRKPTERE